MVFFLIVCVLGGGGCLCIGMLGNACAGYGLVECFLGGSEGVLLISAVGRQAPHPFAARAVWPCALCVWLCDRYELGVEVAGQQSNTILYDYTEIVKAPSFVSITPSPLTAPTAGGTIMVRHPVHTRTLFWHAVHI